MTDAQLRRALALLGIPVSELVEVRAAPSQEEAEKKLVAFKKRLKKAYHKAALELHPDHNPGDKEKEETFRFLTEIYDHLQKLRVALRRPIVPIRIIHFGSSNTGPTVTTVSNGSYRIRIKVR